MIKYKFKNIFAYFVLFLFIFFAACSEYTVEPNKNGYSLEGEMYSVKTQKEFPVEVIKDLGAECIWDLQSIAIEENDKLYLLNGKTNISSIDLTNNEFKKSLKSHGLSSHDNDCCLIENNLYIVGNGAPREKENFKNTLYRWDMNSNETENFDLSEIQSESKDTVRCLSAICDYDGENLFLVTNDCYLGNNTDLKDERLAIYKYNLKSQTAEKLCDYLWDCVYVQGSVYFDNRLYINCNMSTDYPSNYKGIEIKVIDTTDFKVVDVLRYPGKFEPEGLTYYNKNDSCYLVFGIANHGKKCKIVRVKIN